MPTERIWPFVVGSSEGIALGSDTSYYFPINGALLASSQLDRCQSVIRGSYTATSMFVNIGTNLSLGTSTIFLVVNSLDSALKVSIPLASTGTFEDTSNSVALVDGDLVNYRGTVAAGGTVDIQVAGVALHQTGSIGINFMVARGAINFATGTRFISLCGTISGTDVTTEGSNTLRFQSDATLANMRILVSANSQTSGTYVLQLRLAGANGLSSLSIGSAQTGAFEDVTNVDPVNAGTNVNFRGSGGSNGSVVCRLTQIYVTSTAIRLALNNPGVAPATGVMNWPVAGKCSATTTGTANAGYKLPTSGTVSNLWFNATFTPSNTMTVIVVKNDVDTTVTGSVGGAGSGTVGTVVNSASVTPFALGDIIYLRESHTATGTVGCRLISVDFIPDLTISGGAAFDLDRIERHFSRGEGRGYFRGMG